jgi:molybdopterin synthase catalytic subunit
MKPGRGSSTEDRITISISRDPIDARITEGFARTSDGAVVTFVGTVREASDGREVHGLQYEAYEEMAETTMERIASEAFEKWPIGRVLIAHRVGKLPVGEVSVVIAVSAPHRGEAFDACEFCIDTLKQTVPIWKKEHFADGDSAWVGHP